MPSKTPSKPVDIRPAREDDIGALQSIERSAAGAFRQIPALAWIADGDVQEAARHREMIAQGTHWVAVDETGAPSGFLMAGRHGDELHIWEVSVDAGRQGRGIGSALVARAVAAAREAGLAAVTLTTFRDVAWNEPFYRRLGFRSLGLEEAGERLLDILRREEAHGLPGERRCAMRLAIGGGEG